MNRVLRNVFEPKRDEVQETGESGIMRTCMICIPNHIFRLSHQEKRDGYGM